MNGSVGFISPKVWQELGHCMSEMLVINIRLDSAKIEITATIPKDNSEILTYMINELRWGEALLERGSIVSLPSCR